MEISITAVTKNRAFTKALSRHSVTLASLKRLALHIDSSAFAFDILQLVFMDRDVSYIRIVKPKNDRLMQVEVAIPRETDLDYSDERLLMNIILQRLVAAVNLCRLPEEARKDLVEIITGRQNT